MFLHKERFFSGTTGETWEKNIMAYGNTATRSVSQVQQALTRVPVQAARLYSWFSTGMFMNRGLNHECRQIVWTSLGLNKNSSVLKRR